MDKKVIWILWNQCHKSFSICPTAWSGMLGFRQQFWWLWIKGDDNEKWPVHIIYLLTSILFPVIAVRQQIFHFIYHALALYDRIVSWALNSIPKDDTCHIIIPYGIWSFKYMTYSNCLFTFILEEELVWFKRCSQLLAFWLCDIKQWKSQLFILSGLSRNEWFRIWRTVFLYNNISPDTSSAMNKQVE